MFRLKQYEWYRRILGGHYYIFRDGEAFMVQNYTKKTMILANSEDSYIKLVYYPGIFAKPRMLIRANVGNRNV